MGWKLTLVLQHVNKVDVEELAVEQVGELVQGLLHGWLLYLGEVHLANDHHIFASILAGQEKEAVSVGLVVQHWDASFMHIVRLVLHLEH